ncbi:MAG: hypothetical protein Q8936_23665, partial [Bacillota bacterium]|nr:hypothetical protein [Bacillota bacterium]
GITEGKNIYYIATGNYVCIEGMVDRKESRRDCRLITINGIEVKESNLVPSQIEKFHRYKITYLKESNYCIKVEAIK